MSLDKKFALIPGRILLDTTAIGSIMFHCGDGSMVNLEECSEGILWVGEVEDDDGKKVHGLHISTAEYPEEGSTTLAEFAAPQPPALGEESVAWQFYDGGKWHNGMNTNNHRANTEEAGIPVRDFYASPFDASEITRLRVEVAQLRQHKNDYMEAAEETRKALQAEVAQHLEDNVDLGKECSRLNRRIAELEGLLRDAIG